MVLKGKGPRQMRAASKLRHMTANVRGQSILSFGDGPLALRHCDQLRVEPARPGRDSSKTRLGEIVMTQWRDTMVDQPETDGATYLTGWTVSGLAVLGTILAVWAFGI
jgi:hypothetical protein